MMTQTILSSGPMLAFGGGVVLLFVVFAGFIIMMGVMGHKRRAARQAALSTWAMQHGLTYSPLQNDVAEESLFECLRQGSNRYGENWVEGDYHGWQTQAFDYHYETHSTDSKGRRTTHHHYFSAVVVQSKSLLGPLDIRPEGFFDKVGEFFGADDIDFESAEFSRRFFVKSSDKRWAYGVIHQETMQFLLDHAANYRIAFRGHCAIIWNGSMLLPTQYDQALAVLTGVLGRIPDYMVEQRLEAAKTLGHEGPIRW